MKQISKLLLITTFFALAVSLMFVGTASAKYRSDGAVQNASTSAWEVADPGQCYKRNNADPGGPYSGTIVAAADANACRAIISAETVQADCIAADSTYPNYKGRWSGGVCTGNTVYENTYPGNPSGENSALGDREACLHCHDGMGVTHSEYKEVYMKTGHKNMLRKVTASLSQLGPDDVAYDNAGAGTSIDWFAGEITTATGTWPLKWIYGDWLSPTPSAMYLDGTKNMSYSCSKCHATGTSVDSAINVNKEPVVSGQLAVGEIGTGAGQIKLALGLAGYTSAQYASWDQWGIQCSRCHSSASAPEVAGNNTQPLCEGAGYVWVVPGHGSAYCTNYDNERIKWNPDYNDNPKGKNIALLSTHHGGATDGPDVIRLCGECHRQEVSGQPYTFVGTINGTAWNKGFGDQAQTVIGGLSHGAPSPAVGHNYMNVFLNSPHARFSGTYGQITDLANYDSTFMKADPAGLEKEGCLGCHNIHESLVVDGHEPFENECTDCHSAAVPDAFTPQVDIATINHLGGAGTPLEHVAENANHACESCHMTDHAYHFMRISTDPSYVTNNNYSVTGPDNAADDNGYASAVWLDLDLACGQCHGGGTNDVDNPPQTGMPYFTKAQLALVADGIHDAAGVNYGVSFTITADALDVDVDATVDCGGACPALEYDWDWGDGTANGSGNPASHTYLTGGSKTISLTVRLASSGLSVGSYSRSVTLANPNLAPVAAATCVFDANTWVQTVTDASTDDGPDADADNDAIPSLKIVIDWGDGLAKTKTTAGQEKSHTYTKAGIFSASLKAIDNKLQTDTDFCADVTTAYFTIAGEVHKSSGAALSSATVQLLDSKNRSKGTKLTSATGAFSFGSLKPGTYKLKVTKYGYTFPLTTVTIGPDSLGNVITALTP